MQGTFLEAAGGRGAGEHGLGDAAVTGWSVTGPAPMVQRRCQSTEPGAAGGVILPFLSMALPRWGAGAVMPSLVLSHLTLVTQGNGREATGSRPPFWVIGGVLARQAQAARRQASASAA